MVYFSYYNWFRDENFKFKTLSTHTLYSFLPNRTTYDDLVPHLTSRTVHITSLEPCMCEKYMLKLLKYYPA